MLTKWCHVYQLKGKVAIDVVCNPMAKSRGSLIQQFLILTFGSLANSTPYLGVILLIIFITWLATTRSLDSQFTPMAKKDLKDKLMEGKISAITSRFSSKLQQKLNIKYRFVNILNSMGFIEKYVPLVENPYGGPERLTARKLGTNDEINEPVSAVTKQTPPVKRRLTTKERAM